MNLPPKYRLLVLLIAFIGAFAFDKLWLSKHVSLLSDILMLKIDIKCPGISALTIPAFGLIPVFLIVMVIYTLTILPYKNLKDKKSWVEVKGKLKGVIWGILAIPICIVIGAILYLLVEKLFPETATKIAEAFGASLSFFIMDPKEPVLKLEGSIACLLGLITGLYILTKKVK
jgi:hypothetical protein